MPRVKYPGGELDPITKIEDGILATLKKHLIATAKADHIRKVYIVPGNEAADLETKCRAIGKALKADYEIDGEEVHFKRMAKRTRVELPVPKKVGAKVRLTGNPEVIVPPETSVTDRKTGKITVLYYEEVKSDDSSAREFVVRCRQ